VATPARRQACPDRLTPRRLGFYLNDVGLYAMSAGDLLTAREYQDAAVRHGRDARDWGNLAIRLQNLAEDLGWLGEVEEARQAAAEATTHAATTDDPTEFLAAGAYQGWAAMLAGDSLAAEQHFLAADRLEYALDRGNHHLYSLSGGWWGEFLVRTGRPGPARRLTDRNREISAEQGWNQNVARCDRLLAVLDLAAGDPTSARARANAAAATFRDGDYLPELAATLAVLADCARAASDLNAAALRVGEAIDIAGPRGLLPTQAAALAVRARICADRVTAGEREQLARGRDAADTARRIATRHRLAWQELEALEAHARLDQVEGAVGGWGRQAAVLRARLLPDDLDPDPLATVERQAAAEGQAAGEDDE
jgi:hypothetical protein